MKSVKKNKKKEKVILLQDSKIGKEYETKAITRGFATYLWKQKKFLFANQENLIWAEEQKFKKEQKGISAKEKAQSLYQKINNLTLAFTPSKNKEGKLFGSVNFKEILAELKKKEDRILIMISKEFTLKSL